MLTKVSNLETRTAAMLRTQSNWKDSRDGFRGLKVQAKAPTKQKNMELLEYHLVHFTPQYHMPPSRGLLSREAHVTTSLRINHTKPRLTLKLLLSRLVTAATLVALKGHLWTENSEGASLYAAMPCRACDTARS